MIRTVFPTILISAALLSGTVQAQTIGTATTDLNLRSGPDPQFPVIGMLRDRQRATVIGCIEGSRWCQMSRNGRTGWAYSQYMVFSGDSVAVLSQPELEVEVTPRTMAVAPAPLPPAPIAPVLVPVPVPVPVAVYTPAPVAETTAVAPRNYVGRLTPAREVVYAATTPPAYLPSRNVRNFIAANPLETVYLEGNLALGAGLPVEVDLFPVPGSRFSYAYVNDYPVLVEPASRRIVYVYR